ncbi:apoptotic chromatin condensation inducer in the nucleus-like isoform X2 [Anopheles moucheti]|uniref:apoptotic chromatin condensation inducer in the nucleus-like isoform X2 n=1 Tax=Anopheles moucheti TaxID=186751 RepID=UPI0022EFFC49|nr:apoptotic chromatin condensation inducer in the nucleus-like isoform X2 [Anopheles moucheti]
MEAVPIGEEQPEEKEKYPQPDVENCGTVETVASTECTDSRKEATGMDVTNATGTKDEEKENAIPQGRGGGEAAEEAKTSQTTDGEDRLDERGLDSSPDKFGPTMGANTKEEAVKSPELEVFSIDDEEEHEEEEDDEEEMDDEDEEEEYDEMDEDYEVYVEEKESANPQNSMDDDDYDNGSKLDLSTDEYTDGETEELSPEKMEPKSASTTLHKTPSSDLEQDVEDEDDDVQIISFDEEIEEDDEEEEEIEEEEDEDESELDEKVENEEPKSHAEKPKSGSGARHSPPGLPMSSVKYRNYTQKQVASLRHRAIRILNRRSMHVMEDNDDARAVSSDCKVTQLSTDLHSVFATPKQSGLGEILLKAQEKTSYVAASITPADKQNETKDTGITAGGEQGDSKVQPKHPASDTAADAAEAAAKPTNIISSTTSSHSDDKMPTATAVEVSEKIADSSDDAVSVLSSSTSAKKSVTAITPTVNSSASTEAAEQKGKATDESTTDTTAKASEVAKDASSAKETDSSSVGLDKQESNTTNTVEPNSQTEAICSPRANSEPTADDVMAGIDDFMDHTGSEGDEEKQHEKEFNEDLTFQMDVDPPVEKSSSISISKEKNVESAIDLTSTSEPSKEKGEESSSSETHPGDRISTGPSKEPRVDMHDKTVVTSTPVTNQKKGQQKRLDLEEQEEACSSLEVKQEHEQASVVNEAQNLSKQKSSEARGDGDSAHSAQKVVQSDTSTSTNRKRRRSVEIEADRQASAGADSEESIEPAKKLKLEVEATYPTHERVVNDYIETTQNTSVDEIQNHTDTLVKEIEDLNDMIRETEVKWNNLLHLKKVKEEILLRLNRRKHVIGIMGTQLGEVSVFSHLDSSNLSSQHHHQQSGRSSSVGPRPPTPPPEVEIRPASVTNSMHYGFNASNSSGGNSATNGGDKQGSHFGNHSRISNRRSSSNCVHTSGNTSSKARNAKDTNSFVSQFNSSNNAVTMVPLPNTTSMIMKARASMNAAEMEKERSTAEQIHRQIFSKPILSNHQQILNNLAMSAGLTGSSGSASGSNNSNSTGLLNGHHNPGGSNSHAANQQQLQIGRQGMRKDVSSIIADYRQKHPENVPRRGRRLKNVGGNSASNNGTSAGNSIGSFGEGGAISLTALSGGKSPCDGNVRSNSSASVSTRISELLAAAEQSPQQHHQTHHQAGSLHQPQSSLLSKASLPEVTLHPVPNSTAHSDMLGGNVSYGNGSLIGANLSAVNSSTNSLLHGILTKSSNRPGQAASAAVAAAVGNFNTFSPTLARLLTVPERMNSQSSSTVTSGALANLQNNSLTGGLNLSKNSSEISITRLGGPNYQLLSQQQQQQTQQRLREQQLYNLDDEADDSADRLVIDEGDDMGQRDSSVLHGGKRRGAEINENEVPQCQGCKKQEAKFVCAGCGNQWYCSRACQVNAWDDHSEVCSG